MKLNKTAAGGTVLLVLSLLPRSLSADEKLEYRWLYLQTNLQVAENAEQTEALLRRAATANYNGVVLADYKLNILDRVPEHYFKHAARVKRICEELQIELIPTVAPMGYSDGLLAHNPNLAEGLPVQEALFRIQNGRAVLSSSLSKPASSGLLPGGGFEEHQHDAVTGWQLQDGAGEFSFVDTHEKHSGRSSLRWERRGGGSDYLNARVSRAVKVEPWRQFHASVWIRTRQYESAGEVRLFAMGANGRVLSHSNAGVKRDQDWTQHHVIFNTLDNSDVRLYCGTWGIRGGTLWMDDLVLEETAFVNLLRREGCPLRVVAADTGNVFIEGRDFAELTDPKLGRIPWDGNFDVYHEPPALQILPGSGIREGSEIKVSFFHAVTIYDGQVCCCLADPEVFTILEDQVRRVQSLFSPKTWFMSHDEIRVANWCNACRREERSAGQLLAENVRQCADTIRRVSPEAKLCVWSDMFDPQHNAVSGNFYLVNGDLTNAWEGLSKDILIVNWNSGKPQQSLPFFSGRGHSQILAGFYDHDPEAIRSWLRTGRATRSSVTGAMYTTWQGNFSQLEAFAKLAWGN